MAEAPRFYCPKSPNPRDQICIPGMRCYWASQFEIAAENLGASTKELAENDIQDSPGLWVKRKTWDNEYFRCIQGADCCQPRLRSHLMGITDRRKQTSWYLF